MLDTKLISIIIPVYKVEKYINKCIESVLCQTYQNIEIILVDDGSPDQCPKICDEYAKRDSRIRVIHQKNMGLSAARNSGIDIAKGKYVGFVDSDDYIEPDMYEKLYRAISLANAELAICNYHSVEEDGREKERKSLTMKDEVLSAYEALEKLQGSEWWFYVTAWNKLYKKELFDKIRFPVGKVNEDQFIVHELFYECNVIATISNVLYHYVQRKGSIMNSNVSVKRLDDIEAIYGRYIFYKKNHLDTLLPGLSAVIKNQYEMIRWSVSRNSNAEKKCVIRADKMFREVYFSCGEKRSFNDYVMYICPDVGYKLRKIKNNWIYKIKLFKNLLRYKKGVRKSEFILIDTPTHGNLGDHAIVLTMQQIIYDIFKKNNWFELTADEINFREKWFAHITPKNQTILIPGGGFLGALWPLEEERVRRIIVAFRNYKIIIFPQTVTFDLETEEGIRYFRESKECYLAHPDLTIFVREEKSYEFMKKYLPEIKTMLVPDMVTVLNIHTVDVKRKGILMCLRSDKEKILLDEQYKKILKKMQETLDGEKIFNTDTVLKHNSIGKKERSNEVAKKLQEFANAKLVVTDRLHGMVFAAITGTPCIAIGNCNGKIKGMYDWIKKNKYICYLDNLEQLESALDALPLDAANKYDKSVVQESFEPLIKLLIKASNQFR